MKKKIFTIVYCVALLSISTTAYSAEGPYVGGNIGAAILSNADVTDPNGNGSLQTNTGGALGVAVGYDYGNNIRAELEIAYQKNDSSNLTGDTSSTALLLNGYYNLTSEGAFTPFMSGGLGFAKVEMNDVNVPRSGIPRLNNSDTVFAYQLGLGIGYAVNKKVTVDVKYRYFATSDANVDAATAEYRSNNIYIGVRVGF